MVIVKQDADRMLANSALLCQLLAGESPGSNAHDGLETSSGKSTSAKQALAEGNAPESVPVRCCRSWNLSSLMLASAVSPSSAAALETMTSAKSRYGSGRITSSFLFDDERLGIGTDITTDARSPELASVGRRPRHDVPISLA
eukprot:scaffold237_cov117-Isochrysis_galbana.AAC.4